MNCYIRFMFSTREQAVALRADDACDLGILGGRTVWLWVIVVAGAVLRLIALGYKSFWIDEIASVAISRRASPTFWHFLWHDEGNMAAYYVLLRPWLHLGYAEGTVRLLSVIPGVAAIPLMYLLARRLFGGRVAITAALFLSLNACAIYVSQEARAYSFVVFSVLLSTYFFVVLIERPTYRSALVYAVVAGLSCYFHYFCVLAPAAHYVALSAVSNVRRWWRPSLFAAVLILLFSTPILWLMHTQDTGHISWVQPTSWLEVYHLGAYLSAASGKAVGGALLALNLVLIAFFFDDFAHSLKSEETRWQYLLVASLVITPIFLTVLVSIARPAFYHRFLIVCLPGWVLMTAKGASTIRRKVWKVGATLAVCGLSLASTVILYHRATEDWRGAVRYLIAHAKPDDLVLYFQSVGEFAGDNYRDWLPGGTAARPASIPINADGAWKQRIGNAPQVWLVLFRAKISDPEVGKIQQALEQRDFRLSFVSMYSGVTVMEFKNR